MEVTQYWAMGGRAMYLIALLGLFVTPAALVLPVLGLALKRPKPARIFALLLLGLGGLALAMGLVGAVEGLLDTERAVGLVSHASGDAIGQLDPSAFDPLRAIGRCEARVRLVFGLIVAALPLAGGVSLAGIAMSKRPASVASVLGGAVSGLFMLVALVGVIAWQSSVLRAEEAAASRSLEDFLDAPVPTPFAAPSEPAPDEPTLPEAPESLPSEVGPEAHPERSADPAPAFGP